MYQVLYYRSLFDLCSSTILPLYRRVKVRVHFPSLVRPIAPSGAAEDPMVMTGVYMWRRDNATFFACLPMP
jgi:hypothetical protein